MKILKNETGLAIILAAAILGMSFYDGIAIIYLALLFYFLFMVITKEVKITINIGTSLLYLCCLTYFVGILFTNQDSFYNANTYDLINMISVLIFLMMVNQLNTKSYKSYFRMAKQLILFIMFVLSILSLYKYYMLTQGVYLEQYFYNGSYVFGTSLIADNNMFALSMLIGLIFGTSLLLKEKRLAIRLIYVASLTPILLTIAFSGSRRSYVIVCILCLIGLIKLIKSTFSKIKLPKLLITSYFIVFSLTLIFAFSYIAGIKLDVKALANDPQIQSTIQRMSTITLDNANDSFLPRSDRWEYASELMNDAPFYQVWLGRGFDYLHLYVEEFSSNAIEDYPHNPILSALLYSGVIGMLILILFIGYAFYTLFKYRRPLGVEFVAIYISTFMFIMISGNSIFSYKIFLFLSAFPLLGRTIFEADSSIKNIKADTIKAA